MLRIAATVLLIMATSSAAFGDEYSPAANTPHEGTQINEQAMFRNWGVGSMSCLNYVEAREYPDSPVGPYDATFRQWLMGFATAFNIKDPSTTDLLGNTSVERAMAWLEGYCRKNSRKQFFTAVWEFTVMAFPHRVKPDIKVVNK